MPPVPPPPEQPRGQRPHGVGQHVEIVRDAPVPQPSRGPQHDLEHPRPEHQRDDDFARAGAGVARAQADPPLCREQLALSESGTHRQQLVEMIKVLRTHRQQVLTAALVTEIDKSIDVLEKRLAALDRKLRAKIDARPLWKAKFALLTATKGVGFVTALTLLAKMPELGTLNRGQCAALAGLAPYLPESLLREALGLARVIGDSNDQATPLLELLSWSTRLAT